MEESVLHSFAVNIRLGVRDGRVEKSEDRVSLLLSEELAVEGDKGASKVVLVHEGLNDGLEGGAEGSGEEEARCFLELEVVSRAWLRRVW